MSIIHHFLAAAATLPADLGANPYPEPTDLLPDDATLVIQAGFDGSVEIDGFNSSANIVGIDTTYLPPNNWKNMMGNVSYDFLSTSADFSIVDDPFNSYNKVLKCEVTGHTNIRGRAQGAFLLNPWYNGYNEIFYSGRLLLPSDWLSIADPGHKSDWANVFELWDDRLPDNIEPGAYRNSAGRSRVGLRIIPTSPGSGTLAWQLMADDTAACPSNSRLCRGQYTRNDDEPVHLDEWLNVQYYIRKGPDPKTNPDSPARIVVRIQKEHQPWVTLFDIRDWRTEHAVYGQSAYRAFSPQKCYLGDQNAEHMLKNGKRIYQLHDDIKFWVKQN